MEYDFEKLGKEIIVSRFKEVSDPYVLAGEVALKIAVAAVAGTRGLQEPRATVAASCRGVMGGMLLAEKDLAKTAVVVLGQMPALAQAANLDPADCMTWALEGIAAVCRMAPGGAIDAVRLSIDEKFMGAGEVFASLARGASAG